MRDSFYVPLLGGRRDENIEILSADAGGFGSVKIVGDLVRFEAGPDLKSLPLGIPLPFPVAIQYRDSDDKVIEVPIFLTAINTPAGVQLTLPGGRVATESALISPVTLESQLSDPFVFETPPLTVPIFANESILVDIFNAQNPEFIEAFISTQTALLEASTLRGQAIAAVEDAAEIFDFLTEAQEVRALATITRSIADAQAQVLTDLTSELSEALSAITTASFNLALAEEALELAGAKVTAASVQVDFLETVTVTAIGELIQAESTLLVQLAAFGLPAPAEQHFALPGIGPILQSLAANRDQKLAAVEELQEALEVAEAALLEAVQDQVTALSDLAEAAIAFAVAEERLEELGEVDFEALEESVALQDAQATLQEAVADQLETIAAQQLGVAVPISQGTIDQAADLVAQAIEAKLVADVKFAQTQAAFEDAAEAYNQQIEALPDTEFDLAIFAARLGLEANLGLEFHFNRATDEAPAEFTTTLLYDVALDVAVSGVLEVPLPTIFIPDIETPIDIDVELERSGRIELAGRDRPERPERGERFDTDDRLADFGSGERLGNWADSFDFL